ncbi:DUF6485 family protein [uncultured Bilophila sp.]|uniref:DUF6485 family protein n=1 Tax=uncultured Bilophila sp. TaxID=529385 RepID=UPI0025D7E8AB|nr:DUF6485 family protein [uncultured Bilophila sp.]
MENLSHFCSCTDLACPLHPAKHGKGCAPCIQKNLRLKEIPNCFSDLAEGLTDRSGDSFTEFANGVLQEHK